MAIHQPQVYANMDEAEIGAQLGREGPTPTRVVEPAGAVYDPHKNQTDLVLAYVSGSADVNVGGTVYNCRAGDRLDIPGNVEHSAVVGAEGVIYLMTQKVAEAD